MKRYATGAILTCAVLTAAHARAGGIAFTDWATIDTAGNTASGSIGPVSVTFSGTEVSGGVTNNSFTGFANALFDPPLPASDSVSFITTPLIFNYTITFASPLTDPRLHLLSLASTLDFGSIRLTKLSGQPTFVVSGSTVTGAANDFPPPGTPNDANGTVQLNGTFTSVNFTATFPPGNDEIVLQIGVSAPCPADINNSGVVDVDDLVAVILGWGECKTCPAAGCASDIDNDCDTDVDDLVAVILGWGDCT